MTELETTSSHISRPWLTNDVLPANRINLTHFACRLSIGVGQAVRNQSAKVHHPNPVCASINAVEQMFRYI